MDKHALMAEIIENLEAATQNAIDLITAAVKNIAPLLEAPHEHHHALEMGIWSDKSRITDPMYDKLSLLIEKYIN